MKINLIGKLTNYFLQFSFKIKENVLVEFLKCEFQVNKSKPFFQKKTKT